MISISPRFWLNFLPPPTNYEETCAFALDVTPEMLTSERIESVIDLGAKLCGSDPDFPHLKESDPPEWSLELMKVPSAWQRFFPDGSKQPGRGVVVGHPDTGFQPNSEILPNLLIDLVSLGHIPRSLLRFVEQRPIGRC